MKLIQSFLLLFIIFSSCGKGGGLYERPRDIYTTTKATIAKSSIEGEYLEAFPGYPKEWVKFEDGFEFQKVLDFPDTYIFEGDALINEEGIMRLISCSRETKAAVLRDPFSYWRKGVVYYQFDSSATSDFISKVEAAIDDIESCSGVIFYPATSMSPDVINFVKATLSVGNNSFMGCIGGVQNVNLYNYQSHGVIIHEILHALGFFHEHSRFDRDDYITINWENIRPNKQHNFTKYSFGQGYDISSLDDNSLMMYSSYISDPTFVYDVSIPVMYWNGDSTRVFGGQRDELSEGDVKGIVSIYGPPFNSVSRKTTPIQHTIETINGVNYATTIDSVYVSLRFFKERWNATPTHIQYPRSVVLIKTFVTLGVNGNLQRSTYTTNVYSNPEDNVYLVDSFVYRNSTVDDQIVDYYDVEYTLRQ